MTGKRHDFIADCEAGFDDEGRLLALSVMLASRCGYSADLSGPVNDRAMFHIDNAYFLENVEITSHRCKTHTVSNTAFRGFGGPQGMMVIEAILDDIARILGRDPLDIRRINLYGLAERNVTHYGQIVKGNVLPGLFDELERSSDYRRRRESLGRWNAAHPIIKRGLALTPVKFGISFTSTLFNQAGALLQVYTDGTVLLNHGGTEMGQGLHVKVAQVVAAELGLPLSAIRITATDTSKVPNTSATAASSGSDLNGKAAQAAAHVDLLPAAPNAVDSIYRSKAVGEPPLMLALSVFHAIRDACAACGPSGCLPHLPAPATPEAVLRLIDALKPSRAA
jgi:xanthine dehydrogenase large subunit